MIATVRIAPVERFMRYVKKTRRCWRWMGAMHSRRTGYGTFTIKRDGKWIRVFSHRFAYESLVGPIPQGLTIDHLCKNRLCVNPAHLEVVTRGENTLRGNSPVALNARKTHCKLGHPLSGTNLRVIHGSRQCRECSNRRWREYRKRHPRMD